MRKVGIVIRERPEGDHGTMLPREFSRGQMHSDKRAWRSLQAFDFGPIVGALLTIGSIIWSVADKQARRPQTCPARSGPSVRFEQFETEVD